MDSPSVSAREARTDTVLRDSRRVVRGFLTGGMPVGGVLIPPCAETAASGVHRRGMHLPHYQKTWDSLKMQALQAGASTSLTVCTPTTRLPLSPIDSPLVLNAGQRNGGEGV